VNLQQNKPLSLVNLSEENFNLEIEKGLADLSDGRVVSADRVAEKIRRDYDV